MKAVIQRVGQTSLSVDGKLVSQIPFGLAVYLGVKCGDTEEKAEQVANKISKLRIFEDKNGKIGYIGAESFAELTFGLAQELVYGKNIELVILKMPSKEVQCYEEINLWLKFGWIKLYEE